MSVPIEVVGADGKAVTSVRPDQPVEIHATFPPGSALPSSIDVTIQASQGSATVALTRQGDSNTFSSGSLQIGHGVAEGYGLGKGSLARLDVNNGEGVMVNAGAWGGTAVTWYPDALQQAIGEGELVLRGLQSYLTNVQISLLRVPDTPAVREAKQIAKQKSDFITSVLGQLNNDEIWPRSKVYLAQTAISNLLRPGMMDMPEVTRETGNAIQQGKQEGQAIVWHGLADLTKVFYEQYTSATGAAAVWTLLFGQDIYGKEVSGGDRLLAAAEVGANALMVAIPILHMQSMTVPGGTARIPRLTPEIPRPMEGVTPKSAPAAVRATAQEFGMSPEAAAHVNTVASNNGVIIQVRPTNQSAMKWRSAGHPGKPMDVKAKTINHLDSHLGADPEHDGLVWYKKPVEPVRQPGMDDKSWAAVQTRYADRLAEFDDNATKMQHLVDEGKVRINEDGLVIDTGICGGTGKAITGDYDLWRITDLDGAPLSAIDEELIVNQLRFGAYGAQHGAHTSWKIDPNAPMYRADPALLRGHQKVDADIRAKHQLGGTGAEAVIEFGGTNRPPVTAYEGANPPGSVTSAGEGVPTPTPAPSPATAGRWLLPRVAAGAAAVALVAGIGVVALSRSGGTAKPTTSAVGSSATNSTATPPASAAAVIESRPVMSPIEAVFDQSAFTTYYSETAAVPPGATYEWSVSIPADPPCASGFKPGQPSEEKAAWYHADVDNVPSGPCSHAAASGPHGHPGVVTVIIRTRHWTCMASYDGTETGTGEPVAPCLRQ